MSSGEPDSDVDLVKAATGGDASAFETLVDRHQKRVYMISYQILRNHEDTLDVVQDTFIRAWKGVAGFDGQASFASWIARIATNASIDVIRRRQVRPQSELDTGEIHPDPASRTTPSSPPKPDAQIDMDEIRRRYDAALLLLSAEHRAVLVLKELQDQSYQEIADTVGCSVGTVMSRLFYARKKMQSELKDIYEEL
jgi:RNA polymerase sigma-70 factor (ECF subfamily)